MYLSILFIFIAQYAMFVSAIVMVGQFAASRFLKVFRPAPG